MKKKIYFTICIILALIILPLIYLFNEPKFTSEYWLQNKIDKIRYEPIKFCKLGLKRIKYRINNNNEINFEIEINDLGFLIIKRNGWYENSKDVKTYYLNFNPSKFAELEKQFKMQFPHSHTENIDDHFSGKYFELQFSDINEINNNIEVAYYNIEPDENFIDFKNEIIELTKETLNNSH
ncbi:hypothetical protein [Flavobacterium sp. 5]|uniref:hypothetical protein n=1 Tax=Flavobacterium sp. 5 TaxID=2035199 RepID=UPI000CC066CD|nr:hypothetical protein [Flavobacterium sp. 5]PKB15320.1 hypothetical protein CLU82_0390 [Flavobacterium sp. 5]